MVSIPGSEVQTSGPGFNLQYCHIRLKFHPGHMGLSPHYLGPSLSIRPYLWESDVILSHPSPTIDQTCKWFVTDYGSTESCSANSPRSYCCNWYGSSSRSATQPWTWYFTEVQNSNVAASMYKKFCNVLSQGACASLWCFVQNYFIVHVASVGLVIFIYHCFLAAYTVTLNFAINPSRSCIVCFISEHLCFLQTLPMISNPQTFGTNWLFLKKVRSALKQWYKFSAFLCHGCYERFSMQRNQICEHNSWKVC